MCLLENIYFGTHSFDDIHFIDLMMPKMDDFEFIEELKKKP